MLTMGKTHTLTIPYPDELLLSLKESPAEFEREARLLLAVKLYELDKISVTTQAPHPRPEAVAF
ncbi:MAG: UPF0175 family protein [Chloroflexota bacterium]|nr:UPF0175 family protein [Chloroflexota bacterium]